jgi:hypothetical protein
MSLKSSLRSGTLSHLLPQPRPAYLLVRLSCGSAASHAFM